MFECACIDFFQRDSWCICSHGIQLEPCHGFNEGRTNHHYSGGHSPSRFTKVKSETENDNIFSNLRLGPVGGAGRGPMRGQRGKNRNVPDLSLQLHWPPRVLGHGGAQGGSILSNWPNSNWITGRLERNLNNRNSINFCLFQWDDNVHQSTMQFSLFIFQNVNLNSNLIKFYFLPKSFFPLSKVLPKI